MSGGRWKDTAMRLYDTATNFEGAVAAYMKVPDAPHENHVSATWRKLAEAKKRAYDMAKEDSERDNREKEEAKKPKTCPRCGGKAVHVLLGYAGGEKHYVQCQDCGLTSPYCATAELSDEAWKVLQAQMEQAKPAGEGSKDVQ